MNKLPINKYTKIFLRVVKEHDATFFLQKDNNNSIFVNKIRYRDRFTESLNTVTSIIFMPDTLLSNSISDELYNKIEDGYYKMIKDDIIDAMLEVLDKTIESLKKTDEYIRRNVWNDGNLNTMKVLLTDFLNKRKKSGSALYSLGNLYTYDEYLDIAVSEKQIKHITKDALNCFAAHFHSKLIYEKIV